MSAEEKIKTGEKLAEQGNIDDAVSVFREVIKEDSKNTVAYNNLAVLRHAQGDLSEAIQLLTTAIEYDSSYREAICNLVAILTEVNQEKIAVPLLKNYLMERPEDKELHRELVAKRFNKMIDDGLVSEVENILNIEGMSSDSQSMKSVGYRQVCEYLEGTYNFDDMIDRAINSTRQLAKRQMTWISGWSDLVLLEKNRTLPKSVEDLILNNS